MQNTERAIILGAILLCAASLKADELALVNGDATINYESHSPDGSAASEARHVGYDLDFFFREKWFWKNGAIWLPMIIAPEINIILLIAPSRRQLWETEASALSAESGFL